MIEKLTMEFNAAMARTKEKGFYRTIFPKALERANMEISAIAANPPRRSKLAQWLGTMSKGARTKFLANYAPFRMIDVDSFKGGADMRGEMGIGENDYLMFNQVKPIDDILEEAVVAELYANVDKWMQIAVVDAIKEGGTRTQLGHSRESGM